MARPKSLQEEIQQTRPFPSRSNEAILSLLRTADVVRRRITQTLEPYGITTQQYNILRILRGAGPDGLPTLAIGERLIEETPGMTRLLDRLEAKKLVRRHRCTADRRQVLCQITDDGLALLAALDEPTEQISRDSMTSVLDESELQILIDLLCRIRAGT